VKRFLRARLLKKSFHDEMLFWWIIMKERRLRDAQVLSFFLTFIHNKCELSAKDYQGPDYLGKELVVRF